MGDFSFDMQIFKKLGIDIDSIAENGGMVKSEQMSEVQNSIFKALDKNNDGVVDQEEFFSFAKNADESGKIKNKRQDGKLDLNEAQNYFENDDATADKGITKEDVFEFLQNYFNSGIVTAKRTTENNKELVSITYNDGKKEVRNNTDKTVTVTEGNTTTEKRDDGTISKTIVKENGKELTTEYAFDGKTIVKQTTVDETTGDEVVVEYEGGKPTRRTEKSGEQKTVYDAVGDNWRLSSETRIDENGNAFETLYTYSDGVIESETTSQGRIVKKEKITGEDAENFIKRNVITYDDSGGRTEVFTQPGINYEQTDVYNSGGYKVIQQASVNGQLYTANFDGQGHGTLVLKAGESIDKFCQRTGVPKADVMRLNKFPGGIPHAGQEIIVPEQYVKAADSNNYSVSKSVEKAKGDRAEERLNNEVSQRTQEYSTVAEKSTFDEIAKSMFEAEGNSAPTRFQLQKLVIKLKEMNPELQDGNLKGKIVKIPVTESRYQELHRQEVVVSDAKQEQEIIANREIGKNIADGIYDAIEGLGADNQKLNSNLAKINKDNVAHVILHYQGTHNIGINADLGGESQVTKSEQVSVATQIYNKLEARANELGIDVSKYESRYLNSFKTININKGVNVKSVDEEKMDILFKEMATKIALAEGITAGVRNEVGSMQNGQMESSIINDLQSAYDSAMEIFQNQQDYDGWAEDVASGLGYITNVFNGKRNYASAVKEDLEKFKEKTDALKGKTGDEFKAEFKRQFGVDYSPELMKQYQNIREQFTIASQLHTVSKEFNKKTDFIMNKSFSELHSVTSLNSKDVDQRNAIRQAEQILKEYAGLKGFDELVKSCKVEAGLDQDATLNREQKWVVYKKICSQLRDQFGMLSQNSLGGEASFEALSEKYTNSFKAVFGQDDLVARVQDYSHSQMVGGQAVKITAQIAASTLLPGAAAGLTMTVGRSVIGLKNAVQVTRAIQAMVKSNVGVGVLNGTSSFVVESSNVASSNLQQFDEETVESIATQSLGLAAYSTASKTIVKAFTNGIESKVASHTTEIGVSTGMSTGVDVVTNHHVSGRDVAVNLLSSMTGQYMKVKVSNKSLKAFSSVAGKKGVKSLKEGSEDEQEKLLSTTAQFLEKRANELNIHVSDPQLLSDEQVLSYLRELIQVT